MWYGTGGRAFEGLWSGPDLSDEDAALIARVMAEADLGEVETLSVLSAERPNLPFGRVYHMSFSTDDRELYELVLDLQEGSIKAQPQSPIEGSDATRTMELSALTDEVKRRGLPAMYRRGDVYEVKWAMPEEASVTFHTDRYRTFEEAFARAKELQEAFEDIPGYP